METREATCHDSNLEQRQMDDLLDAEVTAGTGTLEQKSWSLTRPVTLIGSSRHAHIRIEGQGIEPVHAALLNTGDTVVLADLNSRAGVYLRNQKIKTHVMPTGGVFRLGTHLLRVDMELPANPPRTTPPPEDLPADVKFTATRGLSGQWLARTVGTVIGGREGCDIRLESRDVLPQHALVSRVGRKVVLASLAADKPIRINSNTVGASVLADGDTLTIWPIILQVSIGRQDAADTSAAGRWEPNNSGTPTAMSDLLDGSLPGGFETMAQTASGQSDSHERPMEPDDSGNRIPVPDPVKVAGKSTPSVQEDAPVTPAKPSADSELQDRLAQIEEHLTTSSRQMEQWQEQLRQYADGLVRRDAALTRRAQNLDEMQARLQEQESRLEQRLRQFEQDRKDSQERHQRLEEQVCSLQNEKTIVLEQTTHCQQERARLEELAASLQARQQLLTEAEARLAHKTEMIDQFGRMVAEASGRFNQAGKAACPDTTGV